jgi:hypothetical protein
MRTTLLALLLIALVLPALAVGKVTTDPNAPGAAVAKDDDETLTDLRLTQTVTYNESRKAVSAILEELTKSTGVTLKAGLNSKDWQVRDRKMSIFARDVPLSELMGSIARVMKFRWERSGLEGEWTYRLFMDRKTLLDAEAQRVRQEQQQEADRARRRQEGLSEYAKLSDLSPQELAKLKTDNPFLYMVAQSGLAAPMGAFFGGSPAAWDAITNGQRLDINAASLSPGAQAGLLQTMHKMVDLENKFSGGLSNTTLPEDLGADPSKVNISINRMLDTAGGRAPMTGLLLGDVTINYEGGSQTLPMFDPNSDAAKLFGKAMLESEEQNRSIDDVMKDHASEFMGVMTNAIKSDIGGEPIAEHPDDPALAVKVTLKPASQQLIDVEKALAEASKFSVVSDFFPATLPAMGGTTAADTPLKEVLDKIAESFVYNWDKHGSVIELHDRNWFRKRAAQLPEEKLEAWRQELIKTGTLDIDSLAQIAQLDQEQLMANIASDDILRTCMGASYSARDVLRLYATLSQSQRAALFADIGLDIASLSPDQMNLAAKFIRAKHAQDLDAGAPIFLVCKRESRDKAYWYAFSLTIDGVPGSTEWQLTTPTYTPPPPPAKDDKTAKPPDTAKPPQPAK